MSVTSKVQYLLATGFLTGYSPVAPGSVASFVFLILYWFCSRPPLAIGIVVWGGIFFLGTWAADAVAREKGKDPQIVVVDEMAGIMIPLLFTPHSLAAYGVIFFCFRFFDIVQPFPIKQMEKLPGGFGIMMDDVFAGFYSLVILLLLLHMRWL